MSIIIYYSNPYMRIVQRSMIVAHAHPLSHTRNHTSTFAHLHVLRFIESILVIYQQIERYLRLSPSHIFLRISPYPLSLFPFLPITITTTLQVIPPLYPYHPSPIYP